MLSTSSKNDLIIPLLGTEKCYDEYDEEMNIIRPFISNKTNKSTMTRNNNDRYNYDDDGEYETGCTIVWSCPTDEDDNDDDDDEEEDNVDVKFKSCFFNYSSIWFILPLLLFLQFGLVFTNSEEQDREQLNQLNWNIVNYLIVLFVIASYLYRRVLRANNCESLIMNLVPDIAVDIILGLVFFHYILYGYHFMILTTIYMSIYSLVKGCSLIVTYETKPYISKK